MSFGSKPAASGPSRGPPARPPKRSQAAFNGDDDDDEHAAPQHEDVSHFDHTAGGAINENIVIKEKELLVIPALNNRDWREQSRRKRQRSGLPVQQEQNKVPDEGNNVLDTRPAQVGLTVRKKEEDDSSKQEAAVEEVVPDVPVKPTDDELAIQALLGDKPKSTLTIPQISEQEAFERDYEHAPDEPSLGDYNAVPVEDFGNAMLRGMGWKDGDIFGKDKQGQKAPPSKPVEKRPALLGIGAKHEKAVADELGAWGKGAKGGKAIKQSYTPVLLKNKNTGETLTEEELKQKIDREKFLVADQKEDGASDRDKRRSEKSSRRHQLEESGHSKSRSDRSKDYEAKSRSSRRDRSSSTDSRQRRRHREDNYSSKGKDRDYRRRNREDSYHSDRRHRDRRRDASDERDRSRKDADRRQRRDDDGYDHSRRDEERKHHSYDDDSKSSRREREDRRRERDDGYDSKRREKVRRDDHDSRRRESHRDRRHDR